MNIERVDSRRLTGPNRIWRRPGAVIDALVDVNLLDEVVQRWLLHARRMLDAVGWGEQELTHRRFSSHSGVGQVSLVLSAPIDALYAATEVNEWAFSRAQSKLDGGGSFESEIESLEVASGRLRALIEEESRPALLELARASAERGYDFLSDDETVSVGSGVGSFCWQIEQTPRVGAVPWDEIGNVPVVRITGTNGKTTTVRLLARIVEEAGLVAGRCSTDTVRVGPEVLERGDYSGPGGARAVLRHRQTQVAILETARGGLMRRGLALPRADVAVITNVAEDHLGEFGLATVEDLLEVKLVATHGAAAIVLNAEDPLLQTLPLADQVSVNRAVRGSATTTPRRAWFGLESSGELLTQRRHDGDLVVTVEEEGGAIVRYPDGDGSREILLPIAEVPFALGGAARHNLANALAAAAAATLLGVDRGAIARGLQTFGDRTSDNPGRLNQYDLDGVRVLVDYAHNPHGLESLLEMIEALSPPRWLVVIGQAGDRDDASIRDLARVVWNRRPDKVIVKDLQEHLRGRQPGEVPEILVDELHRSGAKDHQVDRAGDEIEAAKQALEWGQPGDVVLLLTHENRAGVLEFLDQRAAAL